MKSVVLLLLLLLCGLQLSAQNEGAYEIITPENASRLEPIMSWDWSGTDENRYWLSGAFSPDGQWLVINRGDDALRFLEIGTWEEDFALSTGSIDSYYLQFSLDSNLLLYGDGRCGFIVWDVHSRDLVQLQQLDCETIPSMQDVAPFIDSTSYIVFDTSTKNLRIFDMMTGNERFAINTDFSSPILSNDGVLLATGNEEQNAEIWNTYTQERIGYLKYDADVVNLMGLGFLPDGNIWTNWQYYWESSDGNPFGESKLEVWDIDTFELKTTLIKNLAYANVNVVNDSQFAIVSGLGTDCLCERVFIIDLKTEEIVGETGGNYYVSLNPVGNLYADYSGTAEQVVVREAGSQKIRVYLDTGFISNVEFSPDGRYMLTVGVSLQIWAVPELEDNS